MADGRADISTDAGSRAAAPRPGAPGGDDRPPASIFRNRNFILLWCAYTTSALGDHLSEMALLDMQEATDRDDSTRIGAIILFAFMLPYLLFGPFMGWLADRLPRKWIMVTADVVRAGLMFSLMAVFIRLFQAFEGSPLELRPASRPGHGSIFSPWLYAAPLFVTGLFAAMFSPARAAMLPTLIRTDQIIRGNGLMNAMGPIASIASFLIGAELVARFGPKINFQFDGLTFLLSALLIVSIMPPPRRAGGLAGAARPTGILEGLGYCRTHRRVVELITFTLLFWSAAGVVRSVIPALVGHVFGGDIRDIGYYQATLGIGMLFGALTLAALGDALRSEIAISWSLKGAGLAAVWLAAVAWWRLGQIPGGVGLFLMGTFGSGVIVGANALLQKVVPDFFRGRVFGVKDVVSVGGLVVATGILAIPTWHVIDRYVPLLLLLVGAVLLFSGACATMVRLRRGRFPWTINFWKNLNELFCRVWTRVETIGHCTIPPSGPVIIAANHRSVLDPFVLVATSPNRYISFMIAREYAELPFFGRLVRMIECVSVNRTGVDTAGVRAALRHLENGKCLGIFPEGRIRLEDEPLRVREGVGMLAVTSGATVIPAYISGLLPSKSLYAPFFQRHRARVRYGPPVDLSPWRGRLKDRAAHRQAAEHIMEQINRLRPDDLSV